MSFKEKVLLALFFVTMLTSLWPNNIYVLVLFSVACWGLLPNRWWDGICVSLLAFSVLYVLTEFVNGTSSSGFISLSILLSPVAFYRFGCWLMQTFKSDAERFKIIFLSVFCYLLPLFLLTGQDIALVGIINESRMMLSDLVNGSEHTLSATLYGLMSSVGIGCIAILFTRRTNIREKIMFASIVALSLLVVIHLVNRTGLIILGCCILFSLYYSARMNAYNVLFIVFISTLLIMLILNSGLIGQDLIDAYANREVNGTSNSAELGGRTVRWEAGISDLLTHPFGWDMPIYGYAHNLWIDLAKIGGWGSLFAFLFATLSTLKNCFRIIRKNKDDFSVVSMSVVLAMFMNAFVEPVIEGSMLFLSIFLMFWGIIKAVSVESLDKH